jgi:hypothetical protein
MQLTAAQKGKLATTLRWTKEHKSKMDKFFRDTIQKSKPHKKTNSTHYNQMLKQKRADWRRTHGISHGPRKVGGASNKSTSFIPAPRPSLRLKDAAKHKSSNQGIKRHWQDLTEQGIEPNPGPRSVPSQSI